MERYLARLQRRDACPIRVLEMSKQARPRNPVALFNAKNSGTDKPRPEKTELHCTLSHIEATASPSPISLIFARI
jgi:hypothetical protein